MRPSRPRPIRPTHAVPRACAVLLAVAAIGWLSGCGAPQRSAPAGRGERPGLISGRRAPGPRAPGGAARLARRFARAYAEDAYLRRPPTMPGEVAAVRRAVAAAASRVPPARRHLRPRLLGLRLWLGPGRSVAAAARIGDGRFPPFSVGFTVGRRGGRWSITLISLPD